MTRACGCEPDFDTRHARHRDYSGTESGSVRCIRDTQEPCLGCDVLPVAEQ